MPTGIGSEVGWWCPSLDDSGNGTTALNDLIGSSNGTLTNFALTGSTSNWVADTGSGGVRCLDYDGSNDFVNITRTNTTQSAITLAAWIKTTTSGTRRGVIASGPIQANAYIDLLSTGFLRCAVEDGGSVFIFRDSSVAVNDGNWHHVGMVATPSSVIVYVDGVAVTTGGGTGGILSVVHSRSITIGTNVGGAYGTNFLGRIDDSRLFHSAISAGSFVSLATRRGYQPSAGDFESNMAGGMSGSMTGGMAS